MNDYDVLIVDDEAEICELVGAFTSIAGYRFKTAGSVDEALTFFTPESKPTLMICDVAMPRKSGLDLLRILKERGVHCAVVMLSGHAEGEIIATAKSLGAMESINKPFDSAVLMAGLPGWVEVGRNLQQ